MKRVGVEEAAKHLGCTVGEIRRGYKSGRFPYYRLGGRFWFNPEELEDCLRQEAIENQRMARAACQRGGETDESLFRNYMGGTP